MRVEVGGIRLVVRLEMGVSNMAAFSGPCLDVLVGRLTAYGAGGRYWKVVGV